MSYILPSREVSIKDRQAYRQACTEYIINRALSLAIGRGREELMIRQLLPEDLGLINWFVPSYQHSVKFVNHPIDKGAVIGIYKVLQLGVRPTARKISFRVGRSGATTLGIYDLDIIYSEIPILTQLKDLLQHSEDLSILLENKELVENLQANPMEGYFTEPIRYDPESHALIELSVSESSDNYLVLCGFVCERVGKNFR